MDATILVDDARKGMKNHAGRQTGRRIRARPASYQRRTIAVPASLHVRISWRNPNMKRRRYGDGIELVRRWCELHIAQALCRRALSGGRATLGPPLQHRPYRVHQWTSAIFKCVRAHGERAVQILGRGGNPPVGMGNFPDSFAGHLVVCMGVATFAPICRRARGSYRRDG